MATARQVRERLLKDFEFYAEKALKIRTKKGEIIPLVLKPGQKKLLLIVLRQLQTQGFVRVITLKARQQGLSTLVEALLYWICSQNTGRKGLVVAHDAESTQSLFGMTKRYHENVPEILQPHTKYSNRTELYFDKLDSQITVATAGGRGVGRSQTNTFVHASELAFWPIASAAEIWNGIRQTVADVSGTFIFLESTANGVSGPFYDIWKNAGLPEGHKDRNEFERCFVAWFEDPDYSAPVPVGFERSPEEEALVEKFGLDDGQLVWRRLRIADGGREKFKQEYPATPEEAFLTTGRPVFDAERLLSMLDMAKDAPNPTLLALSPMDKWEPDRRGELRVYREPQVGMAYVIGADVGKGIKGCDSSVAVVMDQHRRVVATWSGIILPAYFARVLQCLGEHYNLAELVVENNDHGILTCYKLQKELNYPYLYQSIRVDKTTDEETAVVGFSTNARTKPLIIDQLRAEVHRETIHVPDEPTLEEMRTFIVNEAGKMKAEDGCHDDHVMALALANHRALDMPPPIKVTDDWYAEAF